MKSKNNKYFDINSMNKNVMDDVVISPRNTGKIERYKKELEDRFTHFYMKPDGSYEFPNSLEGDLLRMTHEMLILQQESEKMEDKK